MKQPYNGSGIEQGAIELLKIALGGGASVRRADARDGADAVIELPGGQEIPIRFVLWSGAGPDTPRPSSPPAIVWVMRRGTRRLHDSLRRHRESFVDLTGTVYLTFPNLLIDRENLPRIAGRRVPVMSFDPFADRSSLVVRTLLEFGPKQIWGVRQLADAAGVGPATVSRIIRELQRSGVVDVRRPGRESRIVLTDSHGLFMLWVNAYDWTKNHRITVHAPIGDPIRFVKRSKGSFGKQKWALTMHVGAALIAPNAVWERLHVYIDAESADQLVALANLQGWDVAREGKLVLMKPYYRESVWHNMQYVGDLPVVSNLQLALDLWHYPLRGREQAEHLIEALGILQ